MIEEHFERRQSDGAIYSVFTLKKNEGCDPAAFGDLGEDRAKEIALVAAETNVTVLELAATVDWLRHIEKCEDWEAEVKKRKGVKVQEGRLDKAVTLLRRLSLN